MKKITLLITSLLPSIVLAQNSFLQLQHTTFKQGSTQDNLSSFYGKVEQKKSFLEGDLELEGGVTANGVLNKTSAPTFFTTVDDADLLIHQLALNYYPSYQTMLSVGREEMNLNLLNGSFDGTLIATSLENLFIKAFYFKHYSYLVPTLYENQALNGLAGVNLNYSKGYFESELSYFNENSEHRSNLYVGFFNKPYRAGVEQMQFLSPTLSGERAYKFLLGMKVKHFYAETGYIDVYEGGLKNIYRFGGSEFNAFGLTSFLEQKNAQDGYLDLTYNHHPLFAKLHLAQTNFDFGASSYQGKEAGVTLGYHYNKQLGLTLQALTQKSNQTAPFGNRSSWLHTNLEYRF